ncbi:beta-ketoacyl synthase N-terminal-like domain-containing protein [Thermoactinomyces sp. CICC 10522]|uniref:beta-ketoacyl synthase N-terminal-like domain-containing protein n=1 Tax=Thermoactinomyces sp. CICC 10522 TaxID=2767427 RepID=UPI0018DE1216|nr:beta-ketoacyl synthase N-terminal-like domain-containing protein [Thermoactinomyces sp. CICC 10522]MBH8605687.1 polyketide synthase dehydratase domain-containing protein [Thermoactinomyces sp. CICC 10522]
MKEVFRLTLTTEHPVISNHSVYSQPLLPGLAYIDLLYQLGQILELDFRDYALKRLSISNPLIVSKDRPVNLAVTFENVSDHWKIKVEGEETDERGNRLPAHRYITAELHQETVAFSEKIDIGGLKWEAVRHFDLDKVYEKARQQGLVHTGMIKAQGEIYQHDSGVLIGIEVDESCQDGADAYLFHPALIDGAAMAAGVLWEQRGNQEDLYLPLYYDEFFCTEPLHTQCYVRALASSVKMVNEIRTLDLAIYNGEGRQIGHLRGITSKKIRAKGQINPALARESFSPPVKPAAEMVTGQRREPDGSTGETGALELMLRKIFARHLDREPSQVRPDLGFFELGLQSSQLLGVMQDIEKELGVQLSPTLLFEYSTIGELALHLAESSEVPFAASDEMSSEKDVSREKDADDRVQERAFVREREVSPAAATIQQDGDIAIIGMAGRFPGASNLREFWANLLAGKDCITEVPSSRWDWKQFSDLRSPSGKKISRWGGFIEDADCFDPYFFRIAPREAEIIDPQERLFLEVCWECMEDAGYVPGTLASPRGPNKTRNVGVFVGVMHKDYALVAAEAISRGLVIPLSLNYAPIANRVSYFCNFHGPSLAVDTVCSSSLVAVHLAIDSIRKGESEVALAGGVNLSLHPNKYLTYGMANMHSSDGYCRSFGKGGDGYVSSDGVGAVLLKPLSRAIEDKDHIYAVIKGSAINHGGTASGITVPNPTAQADLIASCLAETGIDPRTISYVEAHGTGTSLGDPIEIQGLIRAYRQYTSDTQYCAIGSVKSNIGHAESAAGISGLIKNALQLYHQTLVPSLHAEELNPYIDFERSPFYVQQKTERWERPTILQGGERVTCPRRAGLSSFGATGTNVHIIMEECPEFARPSASGQRSDAKRVLVPLSAKSAERLQAYARKLLDYLKGLDDDASPNMEDLAYTLQTGREAMEERVVFIAKGVSDLKRKLESFLQNEAGAEQCYRGHIQQKGTLLPFLAADEDTRELIRKWAVKGKLDQIAQLWVNGIDVDWNLFYVQRRPNRISLPTYPFVKERFWIPSAMTAQGEKEAAVQTGKEQLHPLLHHNTSGFSGLRFTSRFTGQEVLFGDYEVNGCPALPATACLEMVQAAIVRASDGPEDGSTQIVLKDVTCLHPLVVDQNPLQVSIRLFVDEQDEIGYEICRETEGDRPVLYAHGKAVFRSALEAPALERPDMLSGDTQRSIDPASVYQSMRMAGIECGPGYRGMEKVYEDEGQLLVKLTLPSTLVSTQEQLGLHPALLEPALQAAAVFMADASAASAAFHCETVEYFDRCVPSMWALINQSGGAEGKLNIALCDDDGRLCVRMQGISWNASEEELLAGTDELATPTGEEIVMLTSAYESEIDRLKDFIPAIAKPQAGFVRGQDGGEEITGKPAGSVQDALIQSVSRTLGVSAGEVDVHLPLHEYGFDPVSLQEMVDTFNQNMRVELDVETVVELQTIQGIAAHLVKVMEEQKRPPGISSLSADQTAKEVRP